MFKVVEPINNQVNHFSTPSLRQKIMLNIARQQRSKISHLNQSGLSNSYQINLELKKKMLCFEMGIQNKAFEENPSPQIRKEGGLINLTNQKKFIKKLTKEAQKGDLMS